MATVAIHAGLEVTSFGLRQLTGNLASANQEYSKGPTTRGFQVEEVAGANLTKTNKDFDDFRNGELTQIKSTTQVQTRDTLLKLIRTWAYDLGQTEEPYDLRCRDGSRQIINDSQVSSKNLLVVIPAEDLTFTQQSLIRELEAIEQADRVVIAIEAGEGLRGP